MTDSKNGNRRVGAVLRQERSSGQSRDGSDAAEVGRIVRDACRSFALAADWQQPGNGALHRRNGGLDDLRAGYRLCENHVGLHSGMYISVVLSRNGNSLAIRGGRYDKYGQPRNICGESVPLRGVTAESLGCLLNAVHDKLGNGTRA